MRFTTRGSWLLSLPLVTEKRSIDDRHHAQGIMLEPPAVGLEVSEKRVTPKGGADIPVCAGRQECLPHLGGARRAQASRVRINRNPVALGAASASANGAPYPSLGQRPIGIRSKKAKGKLP